MGTKQETISEIGMTKAANRAAKKSMETYGHDATVKTGDQAKRARLAMDKAKGDKSGAVKRATYRAQRAMESFIIEGLTKRLNKAKKQDFEGFTPEDKQKSRKASKTSLTHGKNAEGHAALNMAGHMRRSGNKSGAKLFLKASRNKAFESVIIESVTRILEGRDDTSTDDDSISNAGGDTGAYAKLKAAKQAKASASYSDKDYENNRDNTLGRMGGFKDKKGNSYSSKGSQKYGRDKYSGTKTQVTPLKPKGTPSAGKKVANVRGKTINTSRSTGQEAGKAQANQDAFSKFYSRLGGAMSARVKNFKNGNFRVKQ
jgi:hypothetical protein